MYDMFQGLPEECVQLGLLLLRLQVLRNDDKHTNTTTTNNNNNKIHNNNTR